MSETSLGFIGGSGIYNIEDAKILEEIEVDTPFGKPSSKVLHLQMGDNKIYFLPRHGGDHSILPSEINYRANIYSLKKLGVKNLVSVSAVGSLKEEYSPGSFVLPSQFIDWTKGKRERTFFGNGIVGHISCAEPVNLELRKIIYNECVDMKLRAFNGSSYLCIEGPQFSSKAESNIYRSFGADVIGMTNVPEAYLAKEANISYATIAMVTDYDCWKEEHCTVEEIMKVMMENTKSIKTLFSSLVNKIYSSNISRICDVENSVMTSKDKMTKEQIEICNILYS